MDVMLIVDRQVGLLNGAPKHDLRPALSATIIGCGAISLPQNRSGSPSPTNYWS